MGAELGGSVGADVGTGVATVGGRVGGYVGMEEGLNVGANVGANVGEALGAFVGAYETMYTVTSGFSATVAPRSAPNGVTSCSVCACNGTAPCASAKAAKIAQAATSTPKIGRAHV